MEIYISHERNDQEDIEQTDKEESNIENSLKESIHKALLKGDTQSVIKLIMEHPKYDCHQCDYKAPLRRNLKTHIKIVHEGAKYDCDKCDHEASQKDHFHRHIKSVHAPDDIEQIDNKENMVADILVTGVTNSNIPFAFEYSSVMKNKVM